MIRSLTPGGGVDRDTWGDKAYNLHRLDALGVAVPDGVVLPSDVPVPTQGTLLDALITLCGPSNDARFPVAVRSSAAGEDTDTQSLAGMFLTVLGTMSPADVVAAMERVRESGRGLRVAVILQRLVDCSFSGVAFSMDPVTFNGSSLLIAATEGRGDKLVGGEVSGESLVLARSGEIEVGESVMFTMLRPQLTALREACLTIEREWSTAVDVEWAVDATSGEVRILQSRPVVLPQPAEVELASAAAIDSLPIAVARHSKINLRRKAMTVGVPMSRAAAIVRTSRYPGSRPAFIPSVQAAGLSVVLLIPETVKGSVVREFSSTQGENVDLFIHEDRRYSIQRGPRYADMISTLDAVLAQGLVESHVAVCIVQEIYDASWTGILRSIETGYLIEIARGHFVPKGVVESSRYILDHDLVVVDREERSQEVAYRFVDGHVLQESDPVSAWPNEELVKSTVERLRPMFAITKGALEFGLIETDDHVVSPYLIDIAEADQERLPLGYGLISSGVISPGVAKGSTSLAANHIGMKAMDMHLRDCGSREVRYHNTVFLAERASTDLLPLIYQCATTSAFVFTTGSILGHVGVVLRELGISAVVIDRASWVALASTPGELVEVDALSPERTAHNRVSRIQK
ncbi:PEP/pyruvate-binding domain-containing protein [Amycolatopsis sp. NBC_01307]|uniref:PEP/pyruvate-binding domain-containing protein n=1 Tax=Amycolatopsis sp. NBC_01307 TaxID=2903561 RepID=UPI002E0EE8E6|nr:PEP/pyruvate-binding domain-containing protein [Amycolatopsis sp. NBC_01307]